MQGVNEIIGLGVNQLELKPDGTEQIMIKFEPLTIIKKNPTIFITFSKYLILVHVPIIHCHNESYPYCEDVSFMYFWLCKLSFEQY